MRSNTFIKSNNFRRFLLRGSRLGVGRRCLGRPGQPVMTSHRHSQPEPRLVGLQSWQQQKHQEHQICKMRSKLEVFFFKVQILGTSEMKSSIMTSLPSTRERVCVRLVQVRKVNLHNGIFPFDLDHETDIVYAIFGRLN